jgi:fucose 4-O-acetylase-like acetyltransferase
MSNVRVGWIDMLRGLAVLLVAAVHIQAPLAERVPETPKFVILAGNSIRPFRMPLLFFLSGLFLPASLKKRPKRYVMGKVKSLVWPFILWTAITIVLLWEIHWIHRPEVLLTGLHHLWFLAVLIAYYAVAPLGRCIPFAAWLIPLLVFAHFAQQTHLERYLWFAIFFFAGAVLASRASAWQGLSWPLPALLLCFAGVWALIAAFDWKLRTEFSLFSFPAVISCILGLVWLAPRLPRSSFLEWVGRGSIVVYLTNLITITIAARLLHTFGIEQVWANVAALLFAGLLIPISLIPLKSTTLFVWPSKQMVRRSDGE